MKTVSTKLDNKLHEQFIKICNADWRCQSEMLRDVIETMCEDLEENSQDLEIEDVKPTVEFVSEVKNPRIVYD